MQTCLLSDLPNNGAGLHVNMCFNLRTLRNRFTVSLLLETRYYRGMLQLQTSHSLTVPLDSARLLQCINK